MEMKVDTDVFPTLQGTGMQDLFLRTLSSGGITWPASCYRNAGFKYFSDKRSQVRNATVQIYLLKVNYELDGLTETENCSSKATEK